MTTGGAAVPEHRASDEVGQPDRPPVGTAPVASPGVAASVTAARRGRLDPSAALVLQRTIGNAAVGRILARQSPPANPDLMDPSLEENPYDDASTRQYLADLARLGERVRAQMIDTISGRDAILFMSRLRALSVAERLALRQDAEFWRQLRTFLSGVAYWLVQLRVEYGEQTPPEVRELSTAISGGDWRRTRTLLMGYDSLKRVPGVRDVITARFEGQQADDLRAILVETQTRAESGMSHYQEAHYEGGVIKRFTGDRNYELVRLNGMLRVIVRIGLSEDPTNTQTEITDAVVSRWEAAISRLWNHKFRLRNGTQTLDVWFVPVFIYNDASVHHHVTVTHGGARSDEGDWHSEDQGEVAAHEFGHMLGNPDEYNLPGSTAEIPAALGLTASEQQRSSWQGVTGSSQPQNTAGYSVAALMGNHYRSTAVQLRYAADILSTFNATLRLAGEAPWTVEMQP
jgi:hypothetical protein